MCGWVGVLMEGWADGWINRQTDTERERERDSKGNVE